MPIRFDQAMNPIADLRKAYSRGRLPEPDTHPDPIEQFAKWFDEANMAEAPEFNAMSVSIALCDSGK